MSKTICVALLLTVFCTLASGVHAANYELASGEQLIYLSTGTEGGECRVRDVASSATEVICRDGETMVAASSADGCLDSRGAGYCFRGHPQKARESANPLTCSDGKIYYIHTGIWDDNNCIAVGELKSCMSADRSSGAGASCKVGCENAIGLGVCCIMGPNDEEPCYTVNPPEDAESSDG
jgi:hypothetical protein